MNTIQLSFLGKFHSFIKLLSIWKKCFYHLRPLDKVAIRLGMVDLTDKVFIERKVIKTVNEGNSDMTLLKLDKKVFFHQSVAPICLPNIEDIKPNSLGKIETYPVGWFYYLLGIDLSNRKWSKYRIKQLNSFFIETKFKSNFYFYLISKSCRMGTDKVSRENNSSSSGQKIIYLTCKGGGGGFKISSGGS